MKIVKDPSSRAELTTGQGKILISELQEMAKKMHGDFVKVIVDVEKKIIAVDAPMHSDLFELLVSEENSEPQNLWGINIHPNKEGEDFIEFDSMMNLKPGLGNKSRYVEDSAVREKIVNIIDLLTKDFPITE